MLTDGQQPNLSYAVLWFACSPFICLLGSSTIGVYRALMISEEERRKAPTFARSDGGPEGIPRRASRSWNPTGSSDSGEGLIRRSSSRALPTSSSGDTQVGNGSEASSARGKMTRRLSFSRGKPLGAVCILISFSVLGSGVTGVQGIQTEALRYAQIEFMNKENGRGYLDRSQLMEVRKRRMRS